MKAAKSKYPNFNLKTILICFFFLFLVFLILRSSFSYSQLQTTPPSNSTTINCPNLSPPTCTKIAPSLAHALVHYATLNITPQQTLDEISVSLRVLEKKSPCNFLVFGLGHDSLMWTSLNHGGRTVFLEEDKSWIEQINRKVPSLESYHVVYDTKRTQADELLETSARRECREVSDPRFSKCPLALKGVPSEVYDVEWDVIMVDAPTGYFDGAPGRMSAIYTAGLMARNREDGETDVFVHDVDRAVEEFQDVRTMSFGSAVDLKRMVWLLVLLRAAVKWRRWRKRKTAVVLQPPLLNACLREGVSSEQRKSENSE